MDMETVLHFFWCNYAPYEGCYTLYEDANAEIAKWANYYLSKRVSFHQSFWGAGRVTDNPKDILLGHPTWDVPRDPNRLNWVKENSLLPTEEYHPNTYILTPWVPAWDNPNPADYAGGNMPYFVTQLRSAQKIFALCGEIWIKKSYEKEPGSFVHEIKDKLIHVNMGCASHSLVRGKYKKKFNPIGERNLLHISSLQGYKRFDITCRSVEGLKTNLYVGGKNLREGKGLVTYPIEGNNYSFYSLGIIDNKDPGFNEFVINHCDFYIHTANMDAQATTILENCARGLVPLVTPESGFSSPYAIYLTHDPKENKEIIEWALNLPESDLLERSCGVRKQIEQEHNWEVIFNKIWDEIMKDINNRSEASTKLNLSIPSEIVPQSESTPEALSVNDETEKKVDLHLYISRELLLKTESQIRLERHIERYALLRQFAKGVVVDAACGCGYGSYLLATNPDVELVIGLDSDSQIISYAENEYKNDKTEFYLAQLETWTANQKIDMLISVETIEHIEDIAILPNFVNRNHINHVILTYPSKKTTHYNKYHHHDFRLQDILDMFTGFTCYNNFNWEWEFDVVFLIRN